MFGSKLGRLNPLEGGQVVRTSSPVFAVRAHTLPTGAQPSAPCAPHPRSAAARPRSAKPRPPLRATLRRNRASASPLGHSDNGPCAIDVRVLASHLCVTGQPGMGKTTAMVRLIAQLVSYGISVVVLEPAKWNMPMRCAVQAYPQPRSASTAKPAPPCCKRTRF